MFSVLLIRLYSIRFILNNVFFLVFLIKFREANQIVFTFVATALKALFSIAKTNARLSGCKLYTGDIYFNFFTHIFSNCIQKSAPTEVSAPKNANPNCRQTKIKQSKGYSLHNH